MNVPFIDLKRQHDEILPQYIKELKNIFNESNFILGKEVGHFESDFAKYCNSRFAVGVNSGTDALFLGLLSLGIGKGDKVLVPAYTYIASALAISYTGAQPVFVDIDPLTYAIDIAELKKKIDRRVKAVIPVHLYGQPVDLPSLFKLRDRYGFKVVEDCAQAHGAEWKDDKNKWHRVGSLADVGCFSFYPTKNLGAAGDGGIITTNDKSIFMRLKRLRDYGRIDRYQHVSLGYNSRLDTVQAALLRLKLKSLDKYNKMRVAAAGYYGKLLKDIPDLTIPFISDDVRSVFHIYAVQFKNREKILSLFNKYNISALIHYPIPIHLQKVYKNLGYREGDFPAAEITSKHILSLPIFPHISKAQIEYVVSIIKKASCA